jgi:uncharacterized membrane protein
MLSLILAGLFFILVHVGVSGTSLRDAAIGAVGRAAYMAMYAVVSVVGIWWLIAAYSHAAYVPLWGNPNWWKLVADVMMLPAFLLVVIGLATRSPTAVGQEQLAEQAPHGIARVTRHPVLMGIALWAFLHLVANGDVASVVFFGSFLVVSLAGAPSIDAKRRHALGAPWGAFAARTSIVPFGAIAGGRNSLVLSEIGWWRIGLGALAYALFIGGHVHIIGVSPFPVWH